MSFFDIARRVVQIEVAQAFAKGALNSLSRKTPPVLFEHPIDIWCRENGWTVDEREGDIAILHFQGAEGVRTLSIRIADGGVAVFLTSSRLRFRAVPPAVQDYLLRRNPQLAVGAWSTGEVDGEAGLFLIHRTPAEPLTAQRFRQVCEALGREAADLDGKLRAAGFLE